MITVPTPVITNVPTQLDSEDRIKDGCDGKRSIDPVCAREGLFVGPSVIVFVHFRKNEDKLGEEGWHAAIATDRKNRINRHNRSANFIKLKSPTLKEVEEVVSSISNLVS